MSTRIVPALLLGAATLAASAAAAFGQVSEARVREAIDDASRGLGQALAGGSPLTGPAATTGGLGHFQLGVAGGVTLIEVEDPRREEGTVDFVAPVGTIQGAVGILGGGPFGFGSVDLIGRTGPVVAREEFRDNRALASVGVRVGIVRESPALPAVSATVSRSWISSLAWGDPDGDEVSFVADIATTSARLDVSKSLLLVTPYAGVGVDRTSVDADYRIPPSLSTLGTPIEGHADASSVHQKAYAGVDLALALIRLGVEVGVYDGGAIGAAGLRVGL